MDLANISSRPGTVGKKNGAALGTLGGCLGLFRSCNSITLLMLVSFKKYCSDISISELHISVHPSCLTKEPLVVSPSHR